MVKTYLLFTTPTCSSCPPVKKFLSDLEARGTVSGEQVDVASAGGYEKAVHFGIHKAPTVILFDEEEREVGRAYSITEIKSIVYDY